MKRKLEVSDSFVMFMEDVGVPRKIIFDRAQEQWGPDSKFMSRIRKNQRREPTLF